MSPRVGDTIGDYKVLGVVGVGGMGRVYQVNNLISGRVEAMKILLPNLENEPEAAQRFIREIRVLAGLNHPNITALYAACEIQNQLVMIMEFVAGATLETKLRERPIALEEGVSYIRATLVALVYPDKRSVDHRDIKPSNIIITTEGNIKLMDFGIAKSAVDRKLTKLGDALPRGLEVPPGVGTRGAGAGDLPRADAGILSGQRACRWQRYGTGARLPG